MKKISDFLKRNAHFVVVFIALLSIAIFLSVGHLSADGKYITLDGNDARIYESTEKIIEDSRDAIWRIMNEDAPTDEATIEANDEATGQGAYTTLDQVLARRKPDGDNDGGRGWQCSKYTAYLATGKKDYSSTNPDYGPVNGKDVVRWLVETKGWKYIATPVKGAIGSGGFNTTYGHTVMFLEWIGNNIAMVNDANYSPLKVATHSMNVSGWVWAVPGDYEPTPEPTPTPTPTPTPVGPVSDCKRWFVKRGDTMSAIMKACKGTVQYGDAMNEYAKTWYSTVVKPGQSVYQGWNSPTGVGLFAGDTIENR